MVFKLGGTFFTLSWLGPMEEAQRYSSDVPRARQKGTESNSFLSIFQKGYLKMSLRALGSRRARKVFRVFTLLQTGSN